jgi:hypothetical protein
MLFLMDERDGSHSRELEDVRQFLFPSLSPEAGWARIDRAIRDAADDSRWAAIEDAAKQRPLSDEEWAALEEAARQQDLSTDLLDRLRTSRERDRD